ncbi:MAG TPA: DUF485 domain-containing protein [Gaiellaceae bacterium]|nr:DUF485 domain-containing protein [Gaiellaceae bacterium]
MSVRGGVLERPRSRRTAARNSLEELARRRLRVALILTAAMLVVYFAFILLIAFDKELLGRTLTDGLSLGILLGVLVVLATWALTWIYVAWANRRYEPALRELRSRR